MKRKLIRIVIAVISVVAISGAELNAGSHQHQVQKGDTLWGLSRKYKVPLKSIIQANRIQPTKRLQIGEKILIPGGLVEEVWYQVKPGDTLASIAHRHNVKWQDLQRTNGISSPRRLQVGTKIRLEASNTLHVSNALPTSVSPTQETWYSVKAGDTLTGIAHRHNVKWRDLQRVNGISAPHRLQVGTKIRIPNGSPPIAFALPLRIPLVVTSRYGRRNHPVTGRYQLHEGIDFRAAKGTRVYASRAGKVTFAGRRNGYGKVICIEHDNNFTTWYGHLSRIRVQIGQTVTQGNVIGLSGNTGISTGPHLHFEIRYKGRSENPTNHITIP